MAKGVFSPFWIFYIGFVVFVLFYMVLQGNFYLSQGTNVAAQTLYNSSTILTLLLIFGLAIPLLVGIPRDLIPVDFSGDSKALFSEVGVFLLGFVGWYLILGLQAFSGGLVVLAVPMSSAFSTTTAYLDPVYTTFLLNIAAPVAEELFFGIALVLVFYWVFYQLMRSFGFKDGTSKTSGILVSGAFTALAFAFFHVGNVTILSAAILFRVLLVSFVWGDDLFNLIPKLNITALFGVGAHIANNVFASGGLWKVVGLLLTSKVGIVFLLVNLAFFGLFVNNLRKKLM